MFHHRPTQKAVLLALLATACYLPAMQGTWLFDDREAIVQNKLITEPGGLADIWFSTRPIDYWPVSYTALWIQWRLWGENTTGYHVVNLALHLAAALLAWGALARLKIPGAWTIALLFAVHPVNVETAAWIFQQKTTLAAVGFFAALWAWVVYDDSRDRRWLGAALVCFTLSMLAKTSGVALPPLLLCLAWWRRGRITRADVLATSPLFITALLLGLVSVWFQTYRVVGDMQVREDGPLGRLAGAGWALWFYLSKALVPLKLTFIYPKWNINGMSLWAHLPLLAWILAAACLWKMRHRLGRDCLFAVMWFTLTLAPVLGFVNIGYMRYSLVADHWQYLAILAPLAVLLGGMFHLASVHQNWRLKYVPHTAAAIVAICCLLTWRQAHVYQSEIALWNDTLAKNPMAWVARNNLSIQLAHQNELPAAEDGLREALRLLPGDPTIQSNLAMVLCRRHKFDEAITLASSVLEQRPRDPALMITLGMCHAGQFRDAEGLRWLTSALEISPGNGLAHLAMGQLSLRQGNFTVAGGHFRQALDDDTQLVDAHVGLAQTLAAQGRSAEARKHLELALQRDSEDADAALQMANLMAAEGRGQQAAQLIAEALKKHPNDAALEGAMAERLYALGHFKDAWKHAETALALDPSIPEAQAAAAEVLVALGRIEEAINHYRRAIEINPRLAEAHKALGGLLAAGGQTGEAIHHYRAALNVRPSWPAVSSHLAWLLASQSSANEGEKREALRWAQQACQETGNKHPVALDTLALVYAELGQVDAAVETAAAAHRCAVDLGQHEFAREVRARLESYRGRTAAGEAPLLR